MNIALVGNDGRTNALKWHFKEYGHSVVTFSNPSLAPIVRSAPYDLIILVHVEDSANGLQHALSDIFGSKKVFACSKEAARFETDKVYGAGVARKYGLAAPRTVVVELNDPEDADSVMEVIKEELAGTQHVIKKAGLACGQGVKIVRGTDELNMYLLKWARQSGESALVQEYKDGIEISGRVLCQQGKIIPLWMTMEHKRACNDDRAAMTAEMGTVVLAGVGAPIMEEIRKLEPWLREVSYTGLLDINFIMDAESGKLWFVEPTCRWGDPETEIALPMLDCDFAEIASRACRGEVLEGDIVFGHKAAVGVVIAGGGYPYPDCCLQGVPIDLPTDDYPLVFQMGTEKKGGRLVTKGGRHLVVVGLATTSINRFLDESRYEISRAVQDVYAMVRSKYWFLDAWYRTDIGAKWEKQKPFLVRHGVI